MYVLLRGRQILDLPLSLLRKVRYRVRATLELVLAQYRIVASVAFELCMRIMLFCAEQTFRPPYSVDLVC